MDNYRVRIAAACLFSLFFNVANSQKPLSATQWLTRGDSSVLFSEQPVKKAVSSSSTIEINPGQKFQEIDGFGFALTQGSAMPIIKMSASGRDALLKELFGLEGKAIGISYLRLSIGASDLNETVFSYDDVPAGETDTALTHFDLGPDRKDVLPVLKEILKINPKIKILGSPWSPPAWMKTNADTRGGRLKPEYYSVYARYFIRYLQDMAKEGITIDAITS